MRATTQFEASPIAAESTPAAPSGTVMETPYAWFVVGALALTNMLSMIERQLMSMMFGPIKKDFNLTDTEVSLLYGAAFSVLFVCFGLFVGRMADRYNRRNIIVLGVAGFSLATALCGFARNFTQLFITRMGVGMGEASLNPCAFSILSDYFPRNRLARANSAYFSTSYVGAGLSFIVGGFAIQLVAQMPPLTIPGLFSFSAWQMTFLAVGVGGWLVVIPLLFVREPVRRGVAKMGRAGGEGFSLRETLAFIWSKRRLYGSVYLAYAMMSLVGVGTMTWMPSYFVRVHGWTAHEGGYAFGIMLAVPGGLGVLAGGYLTEWMEKRGYADSHLRLGGLSMCAAALPMIAAVLVPDVKVTLGLLVFVLFFQSLHLGPGMAALQLITPNQVRGQVLAIHFFITNTLGAALGPTIVALLTDKVFRREEAVGYSIALTWALITPLMAYLIFSCLGRYRESLVAARTWDHTPKAHG